MNTRNTGNPPRLQPQGFQYEEMREALTRLLSDAIDHTPRKAGLICHASNRHHSRKAANEGAKP